MHYDNDRNSVHLFKINEAFASQILCSCGELDMSKNSKVNNNYGAMS